MVVLAQGRSQSDELIEYSLPVMRTIFLSVDVMVLVCTGSKQSEACDCTQVTMEWC